MHTLRPYQEEAVAAIKDYWSRDGENPLVELATGTGKSLLQATLAERLVREYGDIRIMSVTHVKELIQQNYDEQVTAWPSAPAGIYSAGLGRRDLTSQIIFAGIQSVYRKARRIGHVDLVMIDEAHLLSRHAESMYGQFLGELVAINPYLKCCGFTATPYRTDSGRLDDGDVRLFDKIVYSYGIADGIKDGYLAPLISKGMVTGFDLTGVSRRGGDYVSGALHAACDKTETTRQACAEIVAAGQNRKSWLAFCAGVEHAYHVRDELRTHGISCETITGDTSRHDREWWIAQWKTGQLRCLTNNSVLTTGINNPNVDLMAMLRPTLSCGLYVQMAGRGTRVAPGKVNCLVLDFAGNVRRHGPVDAVAPRKPGEGKGEAPVKECEVCHSLVHISAKVCPDCGAPFPIADAPRHSATAGALPILSKGAPESIAVVDRDFQRHDKEDKLPTVRAQFNFGDYKHWLCPEHEGYAKRKADRFWIDHKGKLPAPSSVDEFLEREDELIDTAHIQIRRNGKYWEVLSVTPVRQQEELAA